jgi:hypothetical protein
MKPGDTALYIKENQYSCHVRFIRIEGDTIIGNLRQESVHVTSFIDGITWTYFPYHFYPPVYSGDRYDNFEHVFKSEQLEERKKPGQVAQECGLIYTTSGISGRPVAFTTNDYVYNTKRTVAEIENIQAYTYIESYDDFLYLAHLARLYREGFTICRCARCVDKYNLEHTLVSPRSQSEDLFEEDI